MQRRRRVVMGSVCVGIFLFGGYLAACGGDDSVPVSSLDGGGDATTGSDSSSFDAARADAGGGGDAAKGDSGTTDAASDAAPDAEIVSDAGVFTDAGPGGDAAVLNCGGAACNLPAQECCLYDTSGTFGGGCANGAGGCPASTDAGTKLVSLGCEVDENCSSSNVCCITRDTASGSISSSCMNPATCVSGGAQHRGRLCDPAAADAGCGDAGACSNGQIGTWSLPSGFGTCGGVSAN